MCDYSLHSAKSRAAKAGDRLVTASFPYTSTRGFVAVGEPTVAVCLRPGTELAFEKEVKWNEFFSIFFRQRQASGRLVRFRQINSGRTDTHHDAIEFPDGQVVLLTNLRLGQKATVLLLPVPQYMSERDRPDALVIDLVPAAADRSEWFFA